MSGDQYTHDDEIGGEQMLFLREYAVNIIVISILAILFEIILPKTSQKKYINVVIGLVVMMVIIAPLTKLPHYKETFVIPNIRLDDYSVGTVEGDNLIVKEFEKKLALKINEAVHQKFGTVVDTKIQVNVDEKGEIIDINTVNLSPTNHEITTYVSETFGISKDKILGGV